MNRAKTDMKSGDEARPGIILAVADGKRKEAYLSALGSLAELTLTENLRDIPKLLRQAPCKGILIDIILKVRASHMDKIMISDSLEAMPSATLSMDERSGAIRILMLHKKFGSTRTIGEFTALCAAFQPEAVYPDELRALRLNAIISTNPDFGEDAEKTITMFISGSGCFLFTAGPERFEPHSVIWIDFVGISERKPIMGRVLWQCPWGVSHKAPGIYAEFESILESQYDEITSLLANGEDKGQL